MALHAVELVEEDFHQKVSRIIPKVAMLISTLEDKERKIKEIEPLLNYISSQEMECCEQVCEISMKKMSIINRGVTEKKVKEIATLLSFNRESGMSLATVIELFQEKTEISQELAKYVHIEIKCNELLLKILDNLSYLEKKLDEIDIETERWKTYDTLVELHNIFLAYDLNLPITNSSAKNPELLQKLHQLKQYHIEAVKKGYGNFSAVSDVKMIIERKQTLHNLAMMIINLLWYIGKKE